MATHSSILAWRIHGQRSLVGYSPWGRKESDMTERLSTAHMQIFSPLNLQVCKQYNIKNYKTSKIKNIIREQDINRSNGRNRNNRMEIKRIKAKEANGGAKSLLCSLRIKVLQLVSSSSWLHLHLVAYCIKTNKQKRRNKKPLRDFKIKR